VFLYIFGDQYLLRIRPVLSKYAILELEEFSTLIIREGPEDTMFLFGGVSHITGRNDPEVRVLS